jgi:hypothetical protein
MGKVRTPNTDPQQYTHGSAKSHKRTNQTVIYFLLLPPGKTKSQKDNRPRRGQEKSEEDHRKKADDLEEGSARENGAVGTHCFATSALRVIKPRGARPGEMGSRLRSRVLFWAFSVPHSSA